MGFFGSKLVIKTADAAIEVEPDVSVTESHVRQAQVTEHPVEDGSVIGDHKIYKPKVISLTAVISDTPLGLLQLVAQVFQNPFATKTVSQKGWDNLNKMYSEDEPIEIITGLESYTNMHIENLVANRNANTTGGVSFRARFKEIKVVETKTTSFGVRTLGGLNAAATQSTGIQAAKEISLLTKILSLVGL